MSAAALERAIRDGHLPALLRDLAEGSAAEQILARALRRDLALLVERPELLLPCVYRLVHPYFDHHPALRSMLSDWERGHGRPWLRALRPPEIPLDSGLIEEYRGGEGHAAFSSDGSVVGYVKELRWAWDRASGAWERATGRPADPGLLVPRPFKEGAETYGTVVFTHEGRTHEIDVDRGLEIEAVHLGPDNTLIVLGAYEFYGGLVLRVALDSHAILWQTEMEGIPRSLAVGPRLVAASSRGALALLELETGQRVEVGFVPGGTCAWSPDGELLAVGDSGVLRIWDVQRLRERPFSASNGRKGDVAARFSADGTRLLTGDMLWDGVTGKLLAESLAGRIGRGIRLEGGPPADGCKVLADGFIEAEARGVRRWDAAGKLVLEHRDRRYFHDHTVHFADDGAYYGVRQGGEAAVYLYRTADNAELGRFPMPVDQDFEVTVGGEVRPRSEPPARFRSREGTPGLCELVDSNDQFVAAIPAEEPLVGSPDARYWAGRTEHYVLEGVSGR